MVELLVAIALFGVVLMAMTRVFISASESIAQQRLRTAATRVASDHLETLRGLPFADLDAQAGQLIKTTPDGRRFPTLTEVRPIDPSTGAFRVDGAVRQVTVTVAWTSRGTTRNVSYTTAIAPEGPRIPTATQSVGTVVMFPSPAITDAAGRPLQDIEVIVPLVGFPSTTLVHLSWSNADRTAGAKTLATTTGTNWRATISKDQLLVPLGPDGRGRLEFTLSAGTLTSAYTLAAQRVAVNPPLITAATIDRNPIRVAAASIGRTCADANQCRNITDVLFTVSVAGLNPAEDSVILQYQLYDGTFQEVPLTPVGTEWRVTIRQNTTRFRTSLTGAFRFTAIRSADGATASATVLRIVST